MNYCLLEIIACPICNGKLHFSRNNKELICKMDKLAFPFRGDIPILIRNEARIFVSEMK